MENFHTSRALTENYFMKRNHLCLAGPSAGVGEKLIKIVKIHYAPIKSSNSILGKMSARVSFVPPSLYRSCNFSLTLENFLDFRVDSLNAYEFPIVSLVI